MPEQPSAPAAPRSFLRKNGVLILKLAGVVAVLSYLLGSGKLDFERLQIRPDRMALLAAGGALVLLVQILSFARYCLLLRGAEIVLSLRETIRIGFIGTFFNTFMPGGLGGDVVKLYLVIRATGKQAGAVASVMVDRLIGLLGLITLSGLTLLGYWQEVVDTPSLHTLSLAVFGVLGAAGIGLLVSFVTLAKGRKLGFVLWAMLVAAGAVLTFGALHDEPLALVGEAPAAALLRGRALAILIADALLALLCILVLPSCQPGRSLEGLVRKRLPGGNKLMALSQSILTYKNHFGLLAVSFGLSVLLQAIGMLGIYFFSQTLTLTTPPELGHIFFAAPPAFVANALPVSFGGLGVGEAAFQEILFMCRTAAGQPITGGAEIFLVNRFFTILAGLIGLPLYLRGKKEIKAAKEKYLEQKEQTGS